jgi:hypothetical protein
MARQSRAFAGLKSIAWAGIAGLGMVILVVRLDGPAAWLTNFVGVVACKALGLLPYLLPVAWRVLQALAFGGQLAAPCPVQMLVSLWPLVHAAAGAV